MKSNAKNRRRLADSTKSEDTALNPQPLAVDAASLAQMLACSVRSIRRLDRAGLMPSGFRLGKRSKRWAVATISTWISAGCPDRETWNAMQNTKDAQSAGNAETV